MIDGNRYREDPLLASWLRRNLPGGLDIAHETELELREATDDGGPDALPKTAHHGLVEATRETGRVREARIAQFAKIYVDHVCSSECGGLPAATANGRIVEPVESVMHAWHSVCAVASMRRGLALARECAARRDVLGHPLHADALAALEAETWGAFLMAFLLVALQGRLDSGEIDGEQRALLRIVAPLARVVTGKQAVATACRLFDGLGSAACATGSGPGQQLVDALARSASTGPTDALALEALLDPDAPAGLAALMGRVSTCQRPLQQPRLVGACRQATAALERAILWFESSRDREVIEAGAGRLGHTFARSLQLALLCEHAQWLLDHDGDRRGYAAALRFARVPTDLVHEVDTEMDRILLAGRA